MEQNPVIQFLEANGFRQTNNDTWANEMCFVQIIFGKQYVITTRGNEPGIMYSDNLNIYWLLGNLTYRNLMGRSYRDNTIKDVDKWKESLHDIALGAFDDELRFAQNKIMELPNEEQPTENEMLKFLIEMVTEQFKKIFINWDKFTKK